MARTTGPEAVRNSGNEFQYPEANLQTSVRLLQSSPRSTPSKPSYTFQTVSLSDLSHTRYKVLASHSWRPYSWTDPAEPNTAKQETIQINNQPFTIPQGLYDFLSTLQIEHDRLFFIDIISVNQTDNLERRTHALTIDKIIRRADEVAVWFGEAHPSRLVHLEALHSASCNQIKWTPSNSQIKWTDSAARGYSHLCSHVYWVSMRAVQEVLLAKRLTVHYPNGMSFSRDIVEDRLRKTPMGVLGVDHNNLTLRYATEYGIGGYLAAETIVSQRLRTVPSQEWTDPVADGTRVLTLGEITAGLRSPRTQITGYESLLWYSLEELYSIFRLRGVDDPRDRLYGFLGLLRDTTRAQIEPADYDLDANQIFRQALKVGIQEMAGEMHSDSLDFRYDDHGDGLVVGYWARILRYYDNVREAFRDEDETESARVLGEVLAELKVLEWLSGVGFAVQWRRQFGWTAGEMESLENFRRLYGEEKQKHDSGKKPWLWRFHQHQQRAAKSLLEKIRPARNKEIPRRLTRTEQEDLLRRMQPHFAHVVNSNMMFDKFTGTREFWDVVGVPSHSHGTTFRRVSQKMAV